MVYVEELDTAFVFGGLNWKSEIPSDPVQIKLSLGIAKRSHSSPQLQSVIQSEKFRHKSLQSAASSDVVGLSRFFRLFGAVKEPI